MAKARLILTLTLIGCLVVFAVRNAEALEVRFHVWTFTLRRAVMLFPVFVIGVLCGYGLHAATRGGRRA